MINCNQGYPIASTSILYIIIVYITIPITKIQQFQITVGAGAAATILSIHHDLPSAALALVTAVKGRDGAETRPSDLPKAIRRPAPTVMFP